jgi:hypothetical protein
VATLYETVEPNAVEDRMALVRAKLRRDTEACQRARQKWTDWRTHVTSHPWLTCGIAAAAGFLLVPAVRRKGEAPAPVAGLPLPSSVPAGPGIVGRIATEIGRRAAQQALAAGTAWALTRLRAAQEKHAAAPPTAADYGTPATSYSEQYRD